MVDKDLYNLLDPDISIAPAALDDDNTEVAVDMLGFNSALVLIHVGIGGITFTTTNKVEFKLTHSDDDTTYTAVDVGDVIGLDSVATGGIIKSLTAAHAAATITKVGYKGGKRYLKLLADFGGTHSAATPMSALIVKGGADLLPVA